MSTDTRVAPAAITIERWEGGARGARRRYDFAAQPGEHADRLYERATMQLRLWSYSAPRVGHGYDKCGFTIHWADGSTYEGRMDLQHDEFETLRGHVRTFLRFHAGQWRPAHLSADEYAKYLAMIEHRVPGSRAEAQHTLDHYYV